MFSTLFYLSCADKTEIGITLSYYAGDWYDGENHILTITSDGSIDIIESSDNKRIPSSEITIDSATSYTLPDESVLNFSSVTQGTFKLKEMKRLRLLAKDNKINEV